MQRRTARRSRLRFSPALLALLLPLLATVGCQSLGSDGSQRSSQVSPVPIDSGVDRRDLPERLTRWIDGSTAWSGDRRAGTWVATQTDEDTIVAELDWSRFYLRAEVKVRDDEVEIQVQDSEGLGQRGDRIDERASLHLATLRRTIRTALRSPPDDEAGRAVADARRRSPVQPASLPDTVTPGSGVVSDELLGRYHALVIGNDDYSGLPRLRTAVADARAVAAVLERDYAFSVTLMENADRAAIVSALNGYRSSLDTGDNLLIFYAGHGWYDEDAQRGYWLPVGARLEDPSNWVSNATVTDMLRAIPARHVMVVADSCFSGTLTRGIRAKSQDRHLSRLAEQRSRTALTSGGLEPVEDGMGEHSVFAMAFVQALQENDQVLDGHSLFVAMRRPVMLEADQTPEYSDIRRAGHEGGDFLFPKKR